MRRASTGSSDWVALRAQERHSSGCIIEAGYQTLAKLSLKGLLPLLRSRKRWVLLDVPQWMSQKRSRKSKGLVEMESEQVYLISPLVGRCKLNFP